MNRILYILVLITLLGLAVPLSANSKNVPLVRDHIFAQLQQSQQLIDAEKYDNSFELLNKLSEGKLSQYELSQVYQLLAYQFYRASQYQQSINYYQKILALQDLPEFTRNQSLYSLSQLFFTLEDYASASKNLSLWFNANPEPGVDAYELQGQIYYQLKQYPDAIKALKLAIEKNQLKHKPPKQGWLQMLQSMYFSSGDIANTIQVVKQLIRYYPTKMYWLQLAGLYGEQEQKSLQLSVLDAAYTQGFLTRESELKALAYLYIDQKAPFKAATILQQGIESKQIASTEKNLVLLVSAYRMAREIKQSIKTLEQAARTSPQGKLYAELAQLYLVDEQYSQAEQAALMALSRGALKNTGQMYNVLGIALFKQENYPQAQLAFENAKRDPDASKLAVQWEAQLMNIRRN